MRLLTGLLYTASCRYFCKNYAWIAFALIFSVQGLQAQGFSVNAVPQHELCPGNGSLTLSCIDEVPNIPVNYKVYLLPNTTTAIFNSSGTVVNGLNDGTYQVVATQIVNGSPIQATITVVIEDQTIPLIYDVTSTNATCGPDGTITVETLSGNAVTYEIIAGPVTRPPQASPFFNNIPTGSYSVRVTNECGTGIVQVEYVGTDSGILVVGPATFPDIQLPACDLITLAHNITLLEDDMIAQTPFTATITLYPPDNAPPVTYVQTIAGISDGAPEVQQIIPFYYDTPYYYDLEVVDACGVAYTIEDNLVDQALTVNGGFGDAGCPGKYLYVELFKYVAPYTITFNSWPDGFDPESLNPLHPGPFIENITEYGSEAEDIAVPYGVYSFTVTDACGRSQEINNFEIEEPEIEPTVSAFNTNCLEGLGGVEVVVPGFEIVQASITVAPPEYGTVPDDVSEHINDEHRLEIGNLLPPGDYVVVFVDECGREFTEPFTIEFSLTNNITCNVRVDCERGFGTARIASATPVSQVTITQAPADFGTTPYDASNNINAEGQWYMNNLPPGSYKFLVDDACNTDFEILKTIPQYDTTEDELTVTRHCGSFDILLEHTTTSSIFQFYGLQKEVSPGQWGHPETGEIYAEGTEPNEDNALEIDPNVPITSISITGNFRIIKYFESFGTGLPNDGYPDTMNCIEILHEFDFFDDLTFINISNLTCSGDIADVEINYQGAEPITYMITEMNGEPFVVDNGTSNIFYGLQPATYTIIAEDPCGNREPYTFSVAELPSLVTASVPGNLELCDSDGDGSEVFDLNIQTPLVLDGQDPDNFTVTYHLSQADADSGANPLPLNCNTPTATIYARVLNSLNTACHATSFFEVIVREKPEIDMEDSYSICEGDNVTIYAPEGFIEYKWNGVALNRAITVDEGGTYTLEVTDVYGCQATKNLIVAASQAPRIATIEINDWTETNNTITVVVEDSPSAEYFEYSLDGVNYQPGNIFTGLAPGPYTVYVRDIYDCGNDQGDVYLLTYPRFFTPNGDGVNETWRIKFSHMEPDMLVYIYDRFGKIVSSFDANSLGWDGTFNGHRLPATDYWFVVKRQDGKEYKGHFSMIR